MKKDDFDNNLNLKPTFDFALMALGCCELRCRSEKFVIAKRRLRTGSSIDAYAKELYSGGLHYKVYIK
jgi:hypothetical protein